jgi:polyisoprenoid-binding protein YceI
MNPTLKIDASQDTVWFTTNGHAEFTSSVPLHTFTGTSTHLTGLIDFEENLVDFYLDLQSLNTGISRRDRDMYRTLNIEDHPFAEFTGSLNTQIDLTSDENQQVLVTGEFTVHGVTNPVQIEGVLQVTETHLLLEAEWELSISDYEIEPPGILFYRVRDEIQVKISAKLYPENRDELQ